MTMTPYSRQDINSSDVEAVVKVLTSDFLTQGPVVPSFEKAIAKYCGAQYATAVNSATSALHVACLALGVGPGDLVWTTPVTFVATANCAIYCGATVDFVDIDPRTYNISIDCLAEKLKNAEKTGSLPKVIIPVHLCGQSCDMSGIHALAQRYSFKVIEDASHAVGGHYKGEPIGNCRYSDITVFSFHAVKIITSGEGGAALTNDPNLFGKMARLRSHGITRDTFEMVEPSDGPWYYEQIELGYNYRMTDMQAALVLSQMQRLDEFVARRHELANRYDELLKNLPVKTPWQHPDSYSALHLYVVRINPREINASHREVFERLRVNGIGVNLHYIPVYRHPYYARQGFVPADFPEAELYYSEAISLPLYPALTQELQLDVVRLLSTPIGHQTIF